MKRCRDKIFVGKSVQAWARRFCFELPANSELVEPSTKENLHRHSNPFLDTYPQRENLALAKAFTESIGVPEHDFMEACRSYKPESHRLAKIHQIGEVSFWDDSKATNFEAVISACRSTDEPIFWIGGGQSKGVLVDEFARELSHFVDKAFVIGEVGEELAKKINHFGKSAEQCFSLTEAVESAFNEANEKTSVLLSPGFASFDQFTDYSERGKIFNQSVLNLKEVCHFYSRTTVLMPYMEKIIMKLTNIRYCFIIMLSDFGDVPAKLSNCRQKKAPETGKLNAPSETPLNEFNKGTETIGDPQEEVFVAPSRPKPGEIIIPGNEISIPQPSPVDALTPLLYLMRAHCGQRMFLSTRLCVVFCGGLPVRTLFLWCFIVPILLSKSSKLSIGQDHDSVGWFHSSQPSYCS